MEIKDGRITATSKLEAKVFSRLFREQEEACGRDPAEAAEVVSCQQLSGADSYKLFCAAERRINTAEGDEEESKVIGTMILSLTRAHLIGLELELIQDEVARLFETSDSSQAERQAVVMNLAAGALTRRYED